MKPATGITIPGTTIQFPTHEHATQVHCLRCAALSKRLLEVEQANAALAAELVEQSRQLDCWRRTARDMAHLVAIGAAAEALGSRRAR